MKAILIVCVLLMFPVASAAEVLTREQLLRLYVDRVPAETIAQRIGQLIDLIPAGPAKTTVKVTLKQDLADGIEAHRQSLIQNAPAYRVVGELATDATNVGDSDL
jgi:hypothetical protein